ncbi:Cryptochrome/photolyase FAD-binding domain-containing protein [Pseudovirgaria hyperparasitica]|uniref:Cryptochrome/photolyase FAD-binding domain-containing protein n=1 Tax=Pseudovirgaria hyperparasitica TaxID=470096 RepID=A0A6A6VTL7_9PEZI|nr:Cryptochrome/photolyase FAD-binding domain-containing protein [Pseudovirgaria hyperparasitica]KAF2753922.1 Cryptochrome/photolyase FAD-binding domain-containing protein [Pseudovirgaria hyperparasitica]
MSKHERSSSQTDELRHPHTKRAKEIDAHTPLDELKEILEDAHKVSEVKTVLHWFRSKDLRINDNRALDAASKIAKENKAPLITAYLYSPKDLEWHGTSPARSDFIIECLRLMREQLSEKHIPLAIIEAPERGDKTEQIVSFVKNNDVSHVYANLEYEVDELRRDKKITVQLKDAGIAVELVHDQTVLEPGVILNGSGGPHKVFTPYHKAWLSKISSSPDLLDLYSDPEPNEKSVLSKYRPLFDTALPSLPENKQFGSKDERDRIRRLWPAGHDAGMARLEHFVTNKLQTYAETRSNPAKDSTSRLSPYFSSGAISVREALNMARKQNGGSTDFSESSGNRGLAAWVREIVFREFYRQVVVITPHTVMNLPQNLKFNFVQWEDDKEGWEKWCGGNTGVPLIDAGMRHLKEEAWMHNRLRMNTASYLRNNLLIDYRRGERYFAEHLVDWDVCNNTQGWEPSYTVFNPVSQAERNDKDGEYIRRWVKELRDVEGKAVFAPHERLSKSEFEKLGYPRPHVDFNETKERAVARYKRDLHRADP